MEFTASDLQQLENCGIDPQRAARQLALLATGQVWSNLDRPCIPGDGLLQIDNEHLPQLNKHFDQATEAGRISRFVPASGAASRMFKPLYGDDALFAACRAAETSAAASPEEQALRQFCAELPRFAFYPDLMQTMAEAGLDLEQAMKQRDLEPIVQTLLEPSGLGYASLPKGLLAFHQEIDGARTPFIEHLAEAALLNGSDGVARVHFTVSPDHLPLFEAQLMAWQKTLTLSYGCHFDVTYSVQKSATDTLALTADGAPLRDAEGRLVLRPGGHGALIENLNDLSGDIVLVRNIDNVVPDSRKAANLESGRMLGGLLLVLQQEQHALLRALVSGGDLDMVRDLALAFLMDQLQVPVSPMADRETLISLLDRPLRVCGMVPNSGEPGGGPFWVKDASGRISRQIVEGAQIDKQDPDQLASLKASTHFNPVDMACGVRDWQGKPYDLLRFVDEEAVIVTQKSQGGEEIRVLELPGLWNGAMADWHTLFVEIPEEAFNPVKTVFDLLRPAHQPTQR